MLWEFHEDQPDLDVSLSCEQLVHDCERMCVCLNPTVQFPLDRKKAVKRGTTESQRFWLICNYFKNSQSYSVLPH